MGMLGLDKHHTAIYVIIFHILEERGKILEIYC